MESDPNTKNLLRKIVKLDLNKQKELLSLLADGDVDTNISSFLSPPKPPQPQQMTKKYLELILHETWYNKSIEIGLTNIELYDKNNVIIDLSKCKIEIIQSINIILKLYYI